MAAWTGGSYPTQVHAQVFTVEGTPLNRPTVVAPAPDRPQALTGLTLGKGPDPTVLISRTQEVAVADGSWLSASALLE